ncbi:complement resistance protein TraT [Marinomonas rhizomae]|uniref:TraT complement resistance protein n=1 Tax=Marinomonas rhizomae TaxID=491948 RepID=A0A366JCD5_9GAMM|nr:complement resistance protein TraT [Marinomonas rhizomae]RBP83945.1 TraT complement resistance protein [Marinomonas rhizomae]
MNSTLKIGIISAVLYTLVGCSAVNTMAKKQDLSVETRLSHSIVLEPVSPSKRIVYARVRDVSGNQMRKDMQKKIVAHLQTEGFTVTEDPTKANLMLNATILSASKMTADEVSRSLSSGYKGAAEGALIGGGLTAITGGSNSDALKAGALTAVGGFLADAFVEDVYYTFIMDVELRERPLEGDSIENSKKSISAKGMSGQNAANLTVAKSSVERGENYKWITYETRIVTTANQMNLKIEEAIPAVQDKTAYSLSEMLL